MARDFEAMRANKNRSTLPFGHGDTIKMVLIYKNRWLLPDNKGGITTCEEPCYVHVSGLVQHVLGGAAWRVAVQQALGCRRLRAELKGMLGSLVVHVT